jgi:hypothetical protein
VPRLRFTRDERGYEHTFLVHTVRRRGRERTRLLYWFRSPPAVRVGRPALDPDAIRGIEQANPDIVFDWPAILEARFPEAEPIESWRVRRGRAREREGRAGSTTASSAPPPVASSAAARGEGTHSRREDSPAQSNVIADSEDGTFDADQASEGPALELSAVQRALGSEGLLRVRARYAEVLARISSQVTDAAMADELRVLAEQLNPDAWVTAEEVQSGLENFERVLESVRQRLGPLRGRKGRPPAATSARVPTQAEAGEISLAVPDQKNTEPAD